MLQKVKNILLTAAALTVGSTSLLGLATMATVSVASADTNNVTNGLCSGVSTAAGSNGCDTSGTSFSLSGIAASAVNIFSWVVGIVAVIMIIVGGFKYITSGGSSEKIGSAKNTLIYAIIGLIIVALAQFIVHYVITTASNGTFNTGQ